MPQYKLEFNPLVGQELADHARFIARVSRPAAERFYREFEAILDRLKKAPLQFPPYDNPNLPVDLYRRAGFAKWYSIIYYLEDTTVVVDAVIDGRTSFTN